MQTILSVPLPIGRSPAGLPASRKELLIHALRCFDGDRDEEVKPRRAAKSRLDGAAKRERRTSHTANLLFAVTRSPERWSMRKCVSTILKLWRSFSTRQRKRQRQCPENRLRNTGRIFRRCCVWCAHIIAANTTKFRITRSCGSLRLLVT